MKIVVYGHLAEDLQQMIREAMDGNTAIFPESEEALRKEGADAEISGEPPGESPGESDEISEPSPEEPPQEQD